MQLCGECNQPNAGSRCARCKEVYYCDATCQRAHWKEHKKSCGVSANPNPLLKLISECWDAENETVIESKASALVAQIEAGAFTSAEISQPSKVYNAPGEGSPLANWAPVHEAVRSEAWPVLQALLNAGANPNVKDGDGETPIFMAASNNHPVAVPMLVAAGADLSLKASDGWTPVMQCSRFAHVEVLKALLEAGAQVKGGKDMFGRDALDLVQHHMRPGTVITTADDPKGEKFKVRIKEVQALLLAAKQRGQ